MKITILTPTYNRAKNLEGLYKSLEAQTEKNFEWLVVDDGSNDNTKEKVQELLENSSFTGNYVYKDNGGKHSAINFGMQYVTSPLVFIVDSDDYLMENAVQVILENWRIFENNAEVGSFWYLIKNTKNQIVGEIFPVGKSPSSYRELMINKGVKGDKKAVYYTKIRKEFPFPEYENEKFMGESTVHMEIAKKYKSVFINEVIYIGDYLKGGLTDSGIPLRIKNPLGGMNNSKKFLDKDIVFKVQVKKMLLFITYGFFANKKLNTIIQASERPLFASLCSPFSFILYLSWKIKYKL